MDENANKKMDGRNWLRRQIIARSNNINVKHLIDKFSKGWKIERQNCDLQSSRSSRIKMNDQNVERSKIGW